MYRNIPVLYCNERLDHSDKSVAYESMTGARVVEGDMNMILGRRRGSGSAMGSLCALAKIISVIIGDRVSLEPARYAEMRRSNVIVAGCAGTRSQYVKAGGKIDLFIICQWPRA